ncbi:MAG: hypothetical protein HKM05_06740 [Spirochaetales bacterium]|nr:hypothetical protein [Spirochaetales bacterium]
MKNLFRVFAVGLAIFASGCTSPTSSTPSTTTISAPTTLFSDSTLTWSATPTNQLISLQDMGGNGSATLATSTLPASGTFNSYPAYWDGGIGWAMKPTTATGFYDLSGVSAIKFKIKSSSILPSQLAFFIQWQSATSASGNEYTIPFQYSSTVTDASNISASTQDLGVKSISSWTEVTVPLSDIMDTSTSTTAPYTGQPTRYGFKAEPFFATNNGDGSTHVDTPFAIKWYGSKGTSPNSGPLTAGASYQIGDIQFLDASGNNVNIAKNITYAAVPTTLPAAPTLASSSVVALYNSSGTYTDVAMADWQAQWSTAATMAPTTVAGKTVYELSFSSATGYDGADIATPQNITSLTKHLHFDYWTPNGVSLTVKVVDFAPSGSYGTGNVSVTVPLTAVTQNGWTSADLDVSALTDTKYIAQLLFQPATSNTTATQNFWIDNVYFY